MLNGWLIVDKPLGLGSTDIVSAVKRALRDGGYPKGKVGHGGTLDPLATGVLPVALGEATKLAGRMLDSDKAYAFTVAFGTETDTLDAEGQVIATSGVRPTPGEIEAVLPRFTGPIEQVPPAYSALKVEGKRAYDLARAGEEVALAARRVTVHSLARHPGIAPGSRFLAEEGSGIPGRARDDEVSETTLLAHVSKGTYIRSLARDVARSLGSVGHVTYLRRTKAGPFGLDRAISLDNLREAAKGRALERHLLPLRAGLDDIPALLLTPDQAGALRQGRVLDGIAAADGPAFASIGETPVALVDVADHRVRVVRGFNL